MRFPEVDWLRKWAGYTPGRLLLRDHATDRSWTYGDMDRRAAALAAHWRDDLGLVAGDRVAVLALNRVETVLMFFACVKLGTILVPLNFRLTAAELDVLVADCAPAVFYREDELAAEAEALTSLGRTRLVADVEDLDRFLAGPISVPAAPLPPRALDDVVMILYTSGTTGLPKGAMIDHRMLFWNAVNTTLRLDLCSTDHTQSYAPFFHTGGWNVLFTPFLFNGASHTLLGGFDADPLLDLMESEGTTIFFGVPTMLRMMSDAPGFAAADLSSVRYAIVGGAPMPVPLINTWHDKGVPIRQGYGLTEVGPNCFSLHQDDAVRKRGSIGFPNFYVETRIVDEEGVELGNDQVGELWLRGDMVTPGYWNKPAETAAAITDGWFHTGDMVRRDDEGFHSVVDRKKNLIISGGENIYPAEVEAVLAEHEDVIEAAVIGVPDAQWGEVGRAHVVLRAGAEGDEAGLTAFCRERLAGYKTPRHWAFVQDLPRNEAGKIDRKKLADQP
ncbi:MAG: long-chain fatty acid--CoA ligase [bacterium]|nr:long-chain fatty acid--CoA ligase [bacterium]